MPPTEQAAPGGAARTAPPPSSPPVPSGTRAAPTAPGAARSACAPGCAPRTCSSTSRGRFVLDQCEDCAHTFQNPRLTAAGLDFYCRDLHEGLGPAAAERLLGRTGTARAARAAARALLPFGEPESWLDVGTGHALFPAVAGRSTRTPRSTGSTRARVVERAAADGHIEEAHRGPLTELALARPAGGRYDVVSMFHHLEHTPDPRAELRAARTALRPGGHLLIETADPECRSRPARPLVALAPPAAAPAPDAAAQPPRGAGGPRLHGRRRRTPRRARPVRPHGGARRCSSPARCPPRTPPWRARPAAALRSTACARHCCAPPPPAVAAARAADRLLAPAGPPHPLRQRLPHHRPQEPGPRVARPRDPDGPDGAAPPVPAPDAGASPPQLPAPGPPPPAARARTRRRTPRSAARVRRGSGGRRRWRARCRSPPRWTPRPRCGGVSRTASVSAATRSPQRALAAARPLARRPRRPPRPSRRSATATGSRSAAAARPRRAAARRSQVSAVRQEPGRRSRCALTRAAHSASPSRVPPVATYSTSGNASSRRSASTDLPDRAPPSTSVRRAARPATRVGTSPDRSSVVAVRHRPARPPPRAGAAARRPGGTSWSRWTATTSVAGPTAPDRPQPGQRVRPPHHVGEHHVVRRSSAAPSSPAGRRARRQVQQPLPVRAGHLVPRARRVHRPPPAPGAR